MIDWPGASRSPNNAVSRDNFRLMLCFFSHSWTWDQKQDTWRQCQNKWSIDSVSSQQNLQGCDDFMPQIFNILLVARIPNNNVSWKALSLESFYISTHIQPVPRNQYKTSSQLFYNLYGTVVNILVNKLNWYNFLFVIFLFLHTGQTDQFPTSSRCHLPPFMG